MTRQLVILGCSSQQPTRTRSQGSYLLQWNNEGLLFDPGEGTQRQLILANIPPPPSSPGSSSAIFMAIIV